MDNQPIHDVNDKNLVEANIELDYIRGDKASKIYHEAKIKYELNKNSERKEAIEEGEKKGREEGLKEGREEGLKEGKEEGLKRYNQRLAKFSKTYNDKDKKQKKKRINQKGELINN